MRILALISLFAVSGWVYNDAKGRGLPHAEAYAALTLFVVLVGLPVYLVVRARGGESTSST